MKFTWLDKHYKKLKLLETWKLRKIQGRNRYESTGHNGSFDIEIDDDLLMAIQGPCRHDLLKQNAWQYSSTLAFLHRFMSRKPLLFSE